ncbi:MAG: acyltransferase [Bacteroidota bacterium]
MKNLTQSKYFDLIQIFRGIAALMVVVHHTYGSFAHFHHINIPLLKYVASVGKYGVDFFFVLSGFIITYTSFKYGGNYKEIKKYLFNRFVRIYIPYWPIGILMALLYLQFSSYSHGNRTISWIASLFLYPDGKPALSVAWTLMYELVFYALFIIFFLSKKVWYWFVLIWVSIILYCNVYLLSLNIQLFTIFTNHYNLEFILGFLIAFGLRKGLRFNYHLTLLAAISCLGLFLYLTYFNVKTIPFLNNIVFAITGTLFIKLAVCYWDRRISSAGLFMLIGNATYSIYLVHNPLQALLVRLLPKSDNSCLLFYGELILVLAICCAIGFLYYWIFEKILITEIKRRFSPQK